MQPYDWNTLEISPAQIGDSTLLGLSTNLYKTYVRYEDLPDGLIARCDWQPGGDNEYDIVTPFRKGRTWLFETMQSLQPLAWNALMSQGSQLMILESRDKFFKDRYYYSLFLFVSNRCVILRPPFRGFSLSEGDNQFGWLDSMPEAIARAYYLRLLGWHIPVDFPSGVQARQLPADDMIVFDDIIASYGRKERKEAVAALCERFPDVISEDNVAMQFRCYLDTRPQTIDGPIGDQLFAHNTEEEPWDRTVYHIHDGDWRNLRVLTDPVEAIDQYVEHTLLRKQGRFDFLPFSKVLDKSVTEI